MNTNPSMTFSILVLYCRRFHQSLLKSWPIKFTSSNLEVLMHCHKSFQTSATWKEARSCSGRGQEGISKVRRPRCSEETLSLHAGCPQGLQHLFLHIPAGFYCLQLLSKASQERGLGQVWSGNKKNWSVAVGLTNVRMLTVPVGTLISLSHHQELHVKRKSFAFRYCGRELSFETWVTLIA